MPCLSPHLHFLAGTSLGRSPLLARDFVSTLCDSTPCSLPHGNGHGADWSVQYGTSRARERRPSTTQIETRHRRGHGDSHNVPQRLRVVRRRPLPVVIGDLEGACRDGEYSLVSTPSPFKPPGSLMRERPPTLPLRYDQACSPSGSARL